MRVVTGGGGGRLEWRGGGVGGAVFIRDSVTNEDPPNALHNALQAQHQEEEEEVFIRENRGGSAQEAEAVFSCESITNKDSPNAQQAQHRPKPRFDEEEGRGGSLYS